MDESLWFVRATLGNGAGRDGRRFEFVPADGRSLRCVNTEADPAARALQNRDDDVLSDLDLFANRSLQDEHFPSTVAAREPTRKRTLFPHSEKELAAKEKKRDRFLLRRRPTEYRREGKGQVPRSTYERE